MKLCSVVTVAALVAFVGVANAAIVPIGPFTGTYQDSFETQPRMQFLPHYDVFLDEEWDPHGDVNQLGSGQGLHITYNWGYYYTTYPHSGEVFMGPTYGVGAEWVFDIPAVEFGGYFNTNYQSPGATATFYDEDHELLATLPVQAPNAGQWAWDGWACDPPVKYVEIWSNHGAGHIMQDDVQYTPIPEPAALSLLGLGGLALLRRR